MLQKVDQPNLNIKIIGINLRAVDKVFQIVLAIQNIKKKLVTTMTTIN